MSAYPKMPPGTCYPSSRVLAVMYPELTYVEGWLEITVGAAVSKVAHAWCETAEGEIVDSTYTLRDDLERRYLPARRPRLDGRAYPENPGPLPEGVAW